MTVEVEAVPSVKFRWKTSKGFAPSAVKSALREDVGQLLNVGRCSVDNGFLNNPDKTDSCVKQKNDVGLTKFTSYHRERTASVRPDFADLRRSELRVGISNIFPEAV